MRFLPALVGRSVSNRSQFFDACTRRFSAAVAAAAALCLMPLALQASTFVVTTTADNSSSGSLRWAIEQANAAGGTNTITFNVPTNSIITLTSELPVIQDDGLTIDGTSAPGYAGSPVVTIDGGSVYRCFFVGAWTPGTSTQIAVSVTIAGLNMQNCRAQGGSGGGSVVATGGGGAGLGGAIFVANLANVTLSNVTFSNNSAVGGVGGATSGSIAASGGGGMGGNGGSFSGGGQESGGGGLGVGADGGAANGGSGATGIATGAASGGAGPTCGPAASGGSGGGGGGGSNSNSCSAGGGGVGGAAGVNLGDGGAGGFGGGGGAAQQGNGGAGGFGGGGGGNVPGSGNGGAGGFGGGGGGSAGHSAGAGGFGGGNGYGSGNATQAAAGGGGLGAGGAVFIQQGGTLDFSGTLAESGSSVTGGAGGTGAGNGWAVGDAIFIQGNNTISFSPGSGQTETITGAIADQTGSGGTGGNAGAGGVTMNGTGTLVLSGLNTYTGATTVQSGTLDVNGSLSASSTVYVDNGATLGGSGTINGNVVLLGAQATVDNSGGLHINGTTTTWLFSASAGTPQTAYVSSAFAAPLQVTVTANGVGVNGLTVNFTTPGAGASANLSAASCITDVTGSCSVTATANTTPGSYAVTASVSGYSGLGSATFLLANTIPNLVVTTSADDAGTASNCTFQLSPISGTDASCSLRDALLEAAAVGAAGISFDATKFATAQTIALTAALPAINVPVAILGPGANLLTISGSNTNQIMLIGSAGSPTVNIAGLTFANGYGADGGAIYIQGGAVTVAACAFTGNTAHIRGGAIEDDGALNLATSTFSGNSAGTGGGAINSIAVGTTAVIVDSTFQGNTALQGGAINNTQGSFTITNSTFQGNSASLYSGGAVSNQGNLTFNNNVFSDNTDSNSGGAAVHNQVLTANGSNNVYFNNIDTGGGEDDCFDCNTGAPGSNNNVLATAEPLALSLGSYGGPTPTMIPQPGSAAICAGSANAAFGAAVAFDQRGVPILLTPSNTATYPGVGGYCPAGNMDAGAVQTDYALSFTTQPGPISPATSIVQGANFQAAVTLDENGSPFTAASETIPLTLTTGSGTLSNSTASTASGVATYSTLQVSAPGSNDQLTANLTLNTSPAAAISAASSSFNVASSAVSTVTSATSATATFSPSTQTVTLSATVMAGGNPATTGTITFTLKSGSTVVGTATTSGTLSASGSASVSYSLPGGTQAGAYTIDAEYNGGTGFAASSDSTHQLTIGKATPIISTAPTATAITYGQTLASSTLSGGAASYNSTTVAGGFAFTTPATAPNAGTPSENVTFTPTDGTDYTTAPGTATVTVNKAAATVVITGYTVPYDGAAHTATGTATGIGGANLNADLTLTGTTHTNAGVYSSDSWSFTDPNGNYAPQSGTVTDTITPIAPTLGLSGLPAIAYQGGSFTPTVSYNGDGTASVVSQTTSVCTVSSGVVSFVAGGTCTLTASATAGANYAAATGAAQSFWVGPTQAVGSTTSTLTAIVTMTTAGTAGQINVLTQGAANKDFAYVSGGTCATGTAYTANQTCTVELTFTPSRPGQRLGAISLTTGSTTSDTVLGTVPVYGMGTGPLAAFPGSTTISTAAGVTQPWGAAVDGSGDIYAGESIGNSVKEIVAVNGVIPSSPAIVTLWSGFNKPYGVTVDGSGNVYVADYGNNAVKEIVAVNGAIPSNPTILTLGSGFHGPIGVAVDGGGNVYVADYVDSQVREMVAVNGVIPANPTILTLGSGFSFPAGVAVDGSGNVYVADRENQAIKEIVAVNGVIPSNPTIRTLGGGFNDPVGVAADSSGNVYVADDQNNTVKEIVAVNGVVPSSNPTILTLGTGFKAPTSVAVDGSGNVYVADSNNSAVKEIDLTHAPALKFASTVVGQTSSDSPKSVTVQNDGNAALTFNSIVTSNNFALSGTGTCSTSTPLAESGTCTVAAGFTPTTAGSPDTGTITLTDDSLNATGATQAVSLSGTAIVAAATTTAATGATATYSPSAQAVALSATVMAGSNPATTGTVTFTVKNGSTVIGSATTSSALTSSGAVSVSYLLPAGTAAGSYTIQAVYNPGSAFVGSSDTSHALIIGKATPTISTLPTASAIGYGQTLASSTLTGGAATLSGTAVAGKFTFTTPTTAPGGGTSSQSVTFTPTDSIDEAAVTGTVNVTVNKVTPAISLVSSSNPAILTSALTFTATVTSTAGTPSGSVFFYDGTTLLASAALSGGKAAYTTSSLAVATHSITAVYSGDGNFASVTSSAVAEVIQDFTISTPTTGAPSATITPGGTATYGLNIGPSVGTVFPAPVTLSLSGLPPGATGTLNPQTLPAGSSLSSVTLTIQLPQTAKLEKHDSPFRNDAPLFLGLLLLPFARKLRRHGKRLSRMLLLLIVLGAGAAFTIGLSGCGGSSGYFTQAPKTYTMTVTGTCEGVSRSLNVLLTVE